MSNLIVTDFIKDALSQFILSFPNTRVRYEFDINANVHCVEVVPLSTYHLNNEYIDWENNFTNQFIELFPYENICFFSEDAVVGINNIQFELIGSNFVEGISTCNFKTSINIQQIHIHNDYNSLKLDYVNSSNKIFNNVVTNKSNESNIIIEQANSLTSIENQTKAFFSFHFPKAA